ncbi:putative DNA recombination and repair protein Rad54B [Zopfochytrium polystomum]|nr:putative DNA recombination and repair protein Rad54B [Zopfochytrium polystomum]
MLRPRNPPRTVEKPSKPYVDSPSSKDDCASMEGLSPTSSASRRSRCVSVFTSSDEDGREMSDSEQDDDDDFKENGIADGQDDSGDEDFVDAAFSRPAKKLKLETTILRNRPIACLSSSNRQPQIVGHRPLLGFRAPLAQNGWFKRPFKSPTIKDGHTIPTVARAGTQLGMKRRSFLTSGPLHDPEEPGAIILYTPRILTDQEILEASKSTAIGKSPPKQLVHVVVDPTLGRVLRPHQIEGVRFMYNCVTGVVDENAFGCIMADEMGLGKTLQCITLMWTLMRQSPEPGKPYAEKSIIACPSSLVTNWANEIKKWLSSSVNPLVCDGKGTKEQTTKDLQQFASNKGRALVSPVLIISYESLRAYAPLLMSSEFGLMLCDEGHRLKNGDSLTYKALNILPAKRRVLLTGTPIQNDLSEYYSLLSFAAPGVLGTEAEFRKNFENPILRGRDSDASDADRQRSEEKATELQKLANKFIIRRTAELLTKFLPIKYEHVVFCKMSDLQLEVYREYLKSPEVKKLLSGANSQPLKVITLFKKLCNHPNLIIDDNDFPPAIRADLMKLRTLDVMLSGKMHLLKSMLHQIRELKEKIVLISNYTQTLDLFESLCRTMNWGTLRLDGSMTIKRREKIVARFNDPESSEFVFLLSSKAGGCGLNLVGANRLILFDPDWNPATDLQALARVWRDGQKKTCYLYRFIATGSIEEKIFQRQAHKQSLSSCIVDEEQNVERHFSREDLRQLFQLNEKTLSDTHDTFKCKRCLNGRQHTKPTSNTGVGATASDTSMWNHFSRDELPKVTDEVLRECGKKTRTITYVFQNKSHDQVWIKSS